MIPTQEDILKQAQELVLKKFYVDIYHSEDEDENGGSGYTRVLEVSVRQELFDLIRTTRKKVMEHDLISSIELDITRFTALYERDELAPQIFSRSPLYQYPGTLCDTNELIFAGIRLSRSGGVDFFAFVDGDWNTSWYFVDAGPGAPYMLKEFFGNREYE